MCDCEKEGAGIGFCVHFMSSKSRLFIWIGDPTAKCGFPSRRGIVDDDVGENESGKESWKRAWLAEPYRTHRKS